MTADVAGHPPADGPGTWWVREGLAYREGTLHVGPASLAGLAADRGTPLYVYDADRVTANLGRLRAALHGAGLAHRVFYAMKSNRHLPLLRHLRAAGVSGIDACSPNEVDRALAAGFAEEEVSFTATSLSNRDLDRVAARPGMTVNCDSLSAIRRLGERAPGRAIGLRVNPGVGVGYRTNPLLQYAGARPTKFGIYPEAFDEALEEADRHGMVVDGLHVHAGCGYLTDQLEAWSVVLETTLSLLDRLPGPARYVNVGGGLGIPLVEDDRALDLAAWAATAAGVLGQRDVEVWVEPGDYLVKDAGVLVLEVNTVETKRGIRFLGVDGGFNLHVEPAFYGLPLHPVPVRQSGPDAPAAPATVAGNINEALDLLAVDVPLPPVHEGDLLAFLNAGGYGASMSSNHCMRGDFGEHLVGGDGPDGGDAT